MTQDNVTSADTFAKDDASFVEIVTQRYMYKADECKDTPLVGHLLNILAMPPAKGRPWNAFLIRTTRPTKAMDRDKELVDVPVGSEVLISATYELSQYLTKAASNEEKIFEVRIKPDIKMDIGAGQTMWTYKLAAKPQPARRGQFGLAAVLAPLQLVAAGESGGTDSDTPF
jgi:hypothetical protein